MTARPSGTHTYRLGEFHRFEAGERASSTWSQRARFSPWMTTVEKLVDCLAAGNCRTNSWSID